MTSSYEFFLLFNFSTFLKKKANICNFRLPIFFSDNFYYDNQTYEVDERSLDFSGVLQTQGRLRFLKKKNSRISLNFFFGLLIYKRKRFFKLKQTHFLGYLFFKNFLFFKIFKKTLLKNFFNPHLEYLFSINFFILKKRKTAAIIWSFKKKKKNIFFARELPNRGSLKKTGRRISFEYAKTSFFFKFFLKLFSFFFKIKNFLFFNHFFNFFNFLPADFVLQIFSSPKLNIAHEHGLQLCGKQAAYP